jgi:hypothetical protein
MRIFTGPLNDSFKNIQSSARPETIVKLSVQGRKDLMVWIGFITSEWKWLPIPSPYTAPPVFRKELYTDAAGLPSDGLLSRQPGCGGVGLNEDGTIAFAFQKIWDKKFISEAKDERGVRFGDKTTCLEALGMIIPLLTHPQYFRNQNVVVKIDNLGVVWGMMNMKAKEDKCASVIIRATYLICAHLECQLHVEHQPRKTDWGSHMSDRLSRMSSTTMADRAMLRNWEHIAVPNALEEWFRNPSTDWDLAYKLLNEISRT